MSNTIPHRRLEVRSFPFADDSCACPWCKLVNHRPWLTSTFTVLIRVLVGVFVYKLCQYRQDVKVGE